MDIAVNSAVLLWVGLSWSTDVDIEWLQNDTSQMKNAFGPCSMFYSTMEKLFFPCSKQQFTQAQFPFN